MTTAPQGPKSQTPAPPPSVGDAAKAATSPAAPRADDEHVRGPLSCYVSPCPCPGTMGQDGRMFCQFHHGLPVDRWADITLALRNRRWLLDAIGRIHRLWLYPGKAGTNAWVALAETLLVDEPDLHPTALEKQNFNFYEWRLHEDLRWRCGVRSEKPRPRVPQSQSWGRMLVGEDVMLTPRPIVPQQPPLIR
jgi:hypothetical protein